MFQIKQHQISNMFLHFKTPKILTPHTCS